MTGAADFTKMVPGFDFLQNLMKGAGSGLPQVSQWIAPTMDPAELDKRIQDLKTVQFWLEQNTRLLATTIQALEVQRMTLNTLKTMNLPLADLGAALRVPTPPSPSSFASAAASPAAAPAEPDAAAATPRAGVDPMQWWGALTQQFTEIATQALQDNQAESARHAAARLVQQGINAAQQTFQNTLQQAVGAGTGQAAPQGAGKPSRSTARKSGSAAKSPRKTAPARTARTPPKSGRA